MDRNHPICKRAFKNQDGLIGLLAAADYLYARACRREENGNEREAQELFNCSDDIKRAIREQQSADTIANKRPSKDISQ